MQCSMASRFKNEFKMSISVLWYFVSIFCYYKRTIHYSTAQIKLTLKTRPSRLDPRASMLETFKDRVSSLEDRERRLSQICKNSKGFQGNDLFLKGRIIQYCSHLQSSTSVSRQSLSRENFRPKDSRLTVTFQAETTCVQN